MLCGRFLGGLLALALTALCAGPVCAQNYFWSKGTGSGRTVFSSPALYNQNIIVGAGSKLLCFHYLTGDKIWEFQAAGMVDSTPAIGADGTIYFGCSGGINGKFYAVDQEGQQKWSIDCTINAEIKSSPAIGPDGTIYFVDLYNTLHAYSPGNGQQLWSKSGAVGSPAIDNKGLIYVGSVALKPADGEISQTYNTGSVCYNPVIKGERVYLACLDGRLHAFDTYDGSMPIWTYNTGKGNAIYSSPAIGPDAIYVGDSKGLLHAVDFNGQLKWIYATNAPHPIYSSPAVGKDGVIYVGSSDPARLHAVNPANGSKLWTYDSVAKHSSPLIRSFNGQGLVYAGTSLGSFYAITCTSDGLADSTWPLFRGSGTRIGRTDKMTPVQTFVYMLMLLGFWD